MTVLSDSYTTVLMHRECYHLKCVFFPNKMKGVNYDSLMLILIGNSYFIHLVTYASYFMPAYRPVCVYVHVSIIVYSNATVCDGTY